MDGLEEWKWGRMKQITVMEPSAERPSVYDRERAGVQFHQCALLSGQLRRNHNYTLLWGLTPLRFVWMEAVTVFAFSGHVRRERHRQEMDEDNGCILNGPSCHCVYS